MPKIKRAIFDFENKTVDLIFENDLGIPPGTHYQGIKNPLPELFASQEFLDIEAAQKLIDTWRKNKTDTPLDFKNLIFETHLNQMYQFSNTVSMSSISVRYIFDFVGSVSITKRNKDR